MIKRIGQRILQQYLSGRCIQWNEGYSDDSRECEEEEAPNKKRKSVGILQASCGLQQGH